MSRIMLVGPVGAGKTSLIATLQQKEFAVNKTSCIEFHDGAIDTPGEYAQIPRYYSALLVTAMEAGLVIIVHNAAETKMTLPPGFVGMFSKPVIGVVTKVDLPGIDRARAKAKLEEAGVRGAVFYVSSYTGEGIETLLEYIAERGCIA